MIKTAIKEKLIFVRLVSLGSFSKDKKLKQWVLTSKLLLCMDCKCMMTHALRSDFFAVAARKFVMGVFFLTNDDKLKIFVPLNFD